MPSVRITVSTTTVRIGSSATSIGAAAGKDSHRVQRWTGDDVTAHFDLATVARTNSLQVFLNGILQGAAGIDYTEDSDRAGFEFAVAPESGDKIEARYVKA